MEYYYNNGSLLQDNYIINYNINTTRTALVLMATKASNQTATSEEGCDQEIVQSTSNAISSSGYNKFTS